MTKQQMTTNSKKSITITHLTSCNGCQQIATDLLASYSGLRNFYDIKKFEQDANFDIGIIDGHPSNEKQIELAKTIRRHCKTIVAIGSCAHIGGVYSQMGMFLPKEKRPRHTLPEIIKVNYIVPGCPPTEDELTKCLTDLYWGKIFRLPDLGVCFECRQNENVCLIKKKKLCLGPITRAGCDSICINNGEACLGCRGLKPDANVEKMTEVLKPILLEAEIEKTMTIFGDLNQ